VPPALTAVERIQAGGSPNQNCLPHQTARTTTKVDSTMPVIDAYKGAGRQRGTARLRRRSEGAAVTYAKAYATFGLPPIVFGEHNGRNK
jgi:hypothetical protein